MLGLAVALGLAGCGGASTSSGSAPAAPSGSSSQTARTTAHRPAPPKPPSYPHVLRAARGSAPTGFVPAVTIGGRPAAWVARSAAGAGLISFDQRRVELALHSGTIDAGASGWRFGPAIAGAERRRLVGAFNGGFKFSTGAGGFMSGGRTAVRLRGGLGSIVTYTDGYTDIGSWRAGVPAPGRSVASVRQNLRLLIDHGRSAASTGCQLCWGATLGGVSDPARSALGVTVDGRLIWAGGEHLTVSQLAATLLQARVVRAVELDINPEWVASYVYAHRGARGPVTPVAVLAGQPGIPGQFLSPYGRDFYSVLMRSR